jgi:hypothetical protein
VAAATWVCPIQIAEDPTVPPLIAASRCIPEVCAVSGSSCPGRTWCSRWWNPSGCIGHGSRTWPLLRQAPRIGVSILSAAQERACRQLAARGADRFAELAWRSTDAGAVLLDGASGWLDTSIDQQVRAGDHDIVVLRVHDLDADHDISPLVFHASQFRRLQH